MVGDINGTFPVSCTLKFSKRNHMMMIADTVSLKQIVKSILKKRAVCLYSKISDLVVRPLNIVLCLLRLTQNTKRKIKFCPIFFIYWLSVCLFLCFFMFLLSPYLVRGLIFPKCVLDWHVAGDCTEMLLLLEHFVANGGGICSVWMLISRVRFWEVYHMQLSWKVGL